MWSESLPPSTPRFPSAQASIFFRSTDSCRRRGPTDLPRPPRPTTLLRARCAASIFREIENVISEFPPSSVGSASSSSSSPRPSAVRCGDRFPADMRQTFNEAHVKSFHRKPEFHVGNVRQASGYKTVVAISHVPCARFRESSPLYWAQSQVIQGLFCTCLTPGMIQA